MIKNTTQLEGIALAEIMEQWKDRNAPVTADLRNINDQAFFRLITQS